MKVLKSLKFRQIHFILGTIIATGFISQVYSQTFTPKVPTPVEFMAGHERLFFQMVVKKKFTPDSKFGFLSVSTFSSDYGNDLEDLDLVMPVLINYNIYKNFNVVAGTTINNRVGLSPLVGLQHAIATKEWVAVSIASLFLNSSQNIELFGIYEYKPQISAKLNLYTRLQYMYIHNTSANHHARSFLQLRAGLKNEAFFFGLGANLDQYGPEKEFKPNYGIFVGWAFP
jgi:hypothetical protein